MKTLSADALIIGTGLAGLTTALKLTDRGKKVLLLTRAEKPEETATSMAQGGVIFRSKEDSPNQLTADILAAGAGRCLRPAVEILAQEGPALVQEILIDRFGVPFDRQGGGEFHLTGEGAHSHHRILHVGDHTGHEIERGALNLLAENRNVTLLTKHTAVDLLTLSHHSTDPQDFYRTPRCFGAFAFDQKAEEVVAIFAKETVLATGGLGQLYLHTTNPPGARGDGLAMAYRTGARIMNLEYVQFHPTALYGKSSDRFLISEALRGEGAKLLNHAGEEFMTRYDPRGALASRDVVARAIQDEMLREGSQWVYLDISHKEPEWIRQRFPEIHAECLKRGVDITRQAIPVVPAAHYSCGGVAADMNGRTTLANLRAVGEVACTGVHGANRLASTSLLEDLVCGSRAGADVAEALDRENYTFPEIRPWEAETESVDMDLIVQDWITIKHTLWNYVGLIRTPKRLERAQRILADLEIEVEKFYARAKLSDELIGLRNGATVAQLLLTAARRNHQSVGCHYLRSDPN